jgi:hypothetical protein
MKHRTGICSVCCRPDAADIDHALAVSGVSWRAVARKYGLGRSAINRHAHEHLGPRLKRAADKRAAGEDPGLLDKLMHLNEVTKGILARAYNSGDLPTALSAVARAEKQLELEGRLLGLLRDQGGPTINLNLDAATAERMAEIYLARRRGLPAAATAIEAGLLSVSPGDLPAAREPEAEAPAPVASQEPE